MAIAEALGHRLVHPSPNEEAHPARSHEYHTAHAKVVEYINGEDWMAEYLEAKENG